MIRKSLLLAPGAPALMMVVTGVMPDLARTTKYNPQIKVMSAGGYYDLATPYYRGWYEMHHLPIPAELQTLTPPGSCTTTRRAASGGPTISVVDCNGSDADMAFDPDQRRG